MKKLSDLEDVDLLDLDEEYEDDEALYESDYDEEGSIPVRKIMVFVMISAVLLIAIVAAVIVLVGQKDKESAVEAAVSSEADREQERTVQDGDEADTGEAEEETKLPEEMDVKPDDGAEEEAEQTTGGGLYLTVSDHLSGSLRLRGIRSAGQRAVWADQCPAHGYRHCFYAGDL